MKPHGEFCQCCCDRCDWIVIVLQYAEDELLTKRSKFNIYSSITVNAFFFFLVWSHPVDGTCPRKRGCMIRVVAPTSKWVRNLSKESHDFFFFFFFLIINLVRLLDGYCEFVMPLLNKPFPCRLMDLNRIRKWL